MLPVGPSKPLFKAIGKLAHVQLKANPLLCNLQASQPRQHYSANQARSSEQRNSPQPCSQQRINPVGIQMLPEKIYKQIFGYEERTNHSYYNIKRCLEHLRRHDLIPEKPAAKQALSTKDDIVLDIPKLEGSNISTHFDTIGEKFSYDYKQLALALLNTDILKSFPQSWVYEQGWTRYEPQEDGTYIVSKVDAPLEEALIFDVEVCMKASIHIPTLAVAASTKAWYSWCSPKLTGDSDYCNEHLSTKDLIPFTSSFDREKLIIGHNVGFDRSFLSDQYALQDSRTKFLDTLSLHMCVCGMTGLQRAFKCAQKRKEKELNGEEHDLSEEIQSSGWIQESCLNNLADVYEFHCGKKLSKSDRETFIEGSIDDVRNDFQSLMTYCAKDVQATYEVFSKLFPVFLKRFPHPVTLAGMLEMSTMYLPVDAENWNHYIDRSQNVYDQCERQLSLSLQQLADDACSMSDNQISEDIWLWDLDTSRQSIKPNKSKYATWLKNKSKQSMDHQTIDQQVDQIYETQEFLRSVSPFKPGFPKWYRDLCCPHDRASNILGTKEWRPGPILISPQMRITPKLMQLTWEGYPLHHHQDYGWGYLVPNDDLVAQYVEKDETHPYANFPIDTLRALCKNLPRSHILVDDEDNSSLKDDLVKERIEQLKDTQIGTANFIKILKKVSKKKKISPRLKGHYVPEVDIPGAFFIRLPHKNGPNYNVGNPLSKDFVSKMEDGTLSSFDNKLASLLLKYSSSLSYWKNNQNRIKKQMVVTLANKSCDQDVKQAAILPRVIVAGTVTRRAVEPTWLTASNQDTSRVGSELKAMIQAPKGYQFVGADVDSQELWIASLMGDSYSYKIHGGTGLSFMTLRGNKSDKTDMHSKTASLIGISRNDAKVLNYARIYGAGQKFIERFLINTNQQLGQVEAHKKASTIFRETKGVRKYYYIKTDINSNSNTSSYTKNGAISIPVSMSDVERNRFLFEKEKKQKKNLRMFWEGGTESATFNKLEEIASSAEPRTPVLACQISKALEPNQDEAKDFATSRVNWVVQSSAVDFLHLVLVNMRWLFDKLQIRGKFSISIHDEVRYLVKEEDSYKAAFALQISNLMVRSFFAYKLNMKDLPISVAFFSSVDIDRCLRKEVDMDCKSPSNPKGLLHTYGIPPGESLDIENLIKKYTYKVQA